MTEQTETVTQEQPDDSKAYAPRSARHYRGPSS